MKNNIATLPVSKKIYAITLLTYCIIASTMQISAQTQQSPIGANPYTYSPLLFNAENGIMGKYWAGNASYAGKAYIEDEEYTNIVCIKKNQLKKKSNKKLKKHKDFLGSYIDAPTNAEFYLYGNKKNPDPIDDSPDADVITMIAINDDIGAGE